MKKRINTRHLLVVYDLAILAFTEILLLYLYQGTVQLTISEMLIQFAITSVCVFSIRFVGHIYQQIWRYGGIQCYIRLLITDAIAFWINFGLERVLAPKHISMVQLLAIACVNLLGALAIRMIYRYAYKVGNRKTLFGKFLKVILKVFGGIEPVNDLVGDTRKIKIAIIGASSPGVALAEELLSNSSSSYIPCCFVDNNEKKADRMIHGIPVILEDKDISSKLKKYEVQEVVFALSGVDKERKKELYEFYFKQGYKIKVYDYPVMQVVGDKRAIREFDIEELLFRKPIRINNEVTQAYYKDKVILITGGGGSIGSELCRQLAKMSPQKVIILDIFENGAYDVQQELRIAYGKKLDVCVEIVSVNNRNGMVRVFELHHPQIVIHAAAHKHVPLMEHNCIEAVENNVFGTRILVELCEEYGVERFMMVSTDKAVNPTNVMGATKRMCEMIVLSASTTGKVKYSATRFGNVLGSAGSVIPLFKKQIANGGPITITDKRIVRYFMTIPEASQLVLQSGAMANNGELFVLDMGGPVKIYDLAQNMIYLSGAKGIDIVEIGLRPGEKLYEELLIKTETLDKTENSLIFIEKDAPFTSEDIVHKLEILHTACDSGEDEQVRAALHQVVPTFKTPEEVNVKAESAEEMKRSK